MPFLSRAPVPISEHYTLKVCIKLSCEKTIGRKQKNALSRHVNVIWVQIWYGMIWCDFIVFYVMCHCLSGTGMCECVSRNNTLNYLTMYGTVKNERKKGSLNDCWLLQPVIEAILPACPCSYPRKSLSAVDPPFHSYTWQYGGSKVARDSTCMPAIHKKQYTVLYHSSDFGLKILLRHPPGNLNYHIVLQQ
jgi:hypothetical protein